MRRYSTGRLLSIRIGTSGGIDIKVVGGDLIIANGAIRGDGTSKEYIPADYPAVPDFDVLSALVEAAKGLSSDELGNGYHVGVIQSKDSFYGEIEPEKMPVADYLTSRWEA